MHRTIETKIVYIGTVALIAAFQLLGFHPWCVRHVKSASTHQSPNLVVPVVGC